jgi:predicted dehydrogenase
LFDYGIHFVHLAIMFAGPVTSLQYVDALVNEAGLKYVVFGTLHDNGCRGVFELMLDSSSSRSEIEMLGDKGGFALDFFPHGLRILPPRDTPLHRGKGDFRRLSGYARGLVSEHLPGHVPDRAIPHKRLFSAFIRSLQGNSPNPVSKKEVLQTLSLLDEVAQRAYSQVATAG